MTEIQTETQTAGERLRSRVEGDLRQAGFEMSGIEAELLDRAEGIVNSIASLEAVVAEEGPTTTGARGTITHPALSEIRHLSLALHSILKTIGQGLADATAAEKKSRKNASAAWTGRRGNVHKDPSPARRQLPEAI